VYPIQREASEEGDLHGPGSIHDGGQRVGLKLAHFGVPQVWNHLAQQVWGERIIRKEVKIFGASVRQP
jgi:hypothetical protein